MKWLMLAARRQYIQVPLSQMGAVLSAQREWLKDGLADGTLDVAYGSTRGQVSIVNADTAEEIHRIMTAQPIFPIADIDLRPLVDVDAAHADVIREFNRSAAEAPIGADT